MKTELTRALTFPAALAVMFLACGVLIDVVARDPGCTVLRLAHVLAFVFVFLALFLLIGGFHVWSGFRSAEDAPVRHENHETS